MRFLVKSRLELPFCFFHLHSGDLGALWKVKGEFRAKSAFYLENQENFDVNFTSLDSASSSSNFFILTFNSLVTILVFTFL